MLDKINEYIIVLSQIVPLELFTFLGSLLEDIIAPIPSPLITTTAGTLALAKGYGYLGVAWLAFIATLGKTIGCLVIYVIADKAEDLVLVRLGPRIGVSHKHIETIGSYFTGTSKDYLILTGLRALPIIPALPISVVSGVIKIPLKLYLIATLVGTFIRSLLFMAVGYAGLTAYKEILEGVDSIESFLQIGIAVGLVGIIAWFYYKRSKIK